MRNNNKMKDIKNNKFIGTIPYYEENGDHLQVYGLQIPFIIRKGEDGYTYLDKWGNLQNYGDDGVDERVDDRWICELDKTASKTLEEIFYVKCDKSLEVVLNHCIGLHRMSIEIEKEEALKANSQAFQLINQLIKEEENYR